MQTTLTNAHSVLDNLTKKGLQVINPWIRDFPELMYVGLYLPNFYKDGGKLKRGGLTYAEQKALNFKAIGAIEADMTINKNEVVWYEAAAYQESATILNAETASTTVDIAVANTRLFKADDVVAVVPGVGSTTTRVQATIVSVNTSTGVVTLDTAVTCAANDKLMFAYNLITHGTEIDRASHDTDITPVRVYFQKFGGSVEFDSQEINQTRLFVDAQEYVKSKFSIVINRSNNAFARAWYLGRNVAGTKSETQGLETLIQEREAKFGAGTSVIDFAGAATAKAKAKLLVETLNLASTAPVYNGTEVPTVYCNYTFINNLSEIMYDMGNFYTLKDTEIAFGLTKYSSPYFKNVEFIVSHTLNHINPTSSVAYAFPRHLTSFKVPEFQSVDQNGALVKSQATGYSVLKMPQTSIDIVKYTAQMTIANVFAGQTYENSYMKFVNF